MKRTIKLTDTAIRRPVTTLVLVLAAVFFGTWSYLNMRMELMPNVDIPVATVSTTLIGASPEVMDRDVTDVLEEQLNTIEGIDSITSQSYEGRSIIMIEFDLERDIDDAVADVRAKVNLAKRDLPEDCEDSIIDKFDTGDFPVVTLAVSGGDNERTRAHFVDEVLKPRLETITGVGAINTVGYYDREIRVWLKPDRLEAYNLSASDVSKAIRERHLELPGGRIENSFSELSIRVEGEYPDVESLETLVVKDLGEAKVRLRDVAEVLDGEEDVRSGAYLNGQPVISVEVQKSSGSNEVLVCDLVRAEINKIAKSAPEGVELTICSDSSEYIRRSMSGVQNDLLIGVVLTSLLMFLFLRSLRVTIVAIVAIPTSIISAFMICRALDLTINNMVMMAMSLAIGMVIDNAIVVIENIFRHLEKGTPLIQAVREATGEVGFAVMAGTATTVAVFFPVATMDGVIGRFFFSFGITIVATMIVSLIVSLTLTPFLSSRILKRSEKHGMLYRLLDLPMVGLERLYRFVLRWALSHRFLTLLIAGLTFFAGIQFARGLGSSFTPDQDKGETTVDYELPIGSSIEESRRLVLEISDLIQQEPEVDLVLATYGSGNGGQVNEGQLYVKLCPLDERTISAAQFEERTRRKLSGYRDVLLQIGSGFGGGDAEQTLQADSLDELATVSAAMVEDLKQVEGLADIQSDLRLTKPMVKVKINRSRADDLEVNVDTIANEIQTFFSGQDATVFNTDTDRFDINLKADANDRFTPENLSRISVRSENDKLIRLGSLIETDVSTGPNGIKRYNRRYAATVSANTTGSFSTGEAVVEIQKAFNHHAPTDGSVRTLMTGSAERMQESFGFLIEALIMALIIVYVVMAVQFESFLHPFTVMGSLPLAISGVFGLYVLLDLNISIMTFIGMILLVGIVVNNAILLVDFANQRKARGADSRTAMLEAGPLRLRPIIMTAASTMISSLPIALGLSEGSEFRQPMSIAVIGGMFTSTTLTLVVIPVVYVTMDGIANRVCRWFPHHHESTDVPVSQVPQEVES